MAATTKSSLLSQLGIGPGPNDSLRQARILLVDANLSRRALHRQWLEIAGAPEPDTADSGNDALDVLGARAQQFDLVAIWPPLADADTVDICGVLRRCRSPVRLMAVTSATPLSLGKAGMLAGVAAVDDSATPRGFINVVRTLLASDATIAAIVATKSVPGMLGCIWAEAIYGATPGSRFYSDLD